MFFSKDIIVTKDLGLNIKTLNHVPKSLMDIRSSLGLQPVARKKWGIVKEFRPQKRTCFIGQ